MPTPEPVTLEECPVCGTTSWAGEDWSTLTEILAAHAEQMHPEEPCPDFTAEHPVQIPGSMYAVWQAGTIVRWEWSPAASNAGYFGPSAITEVGDVWLRGGFDHRHTSTDGPVWDAIHDSIIAGTFSPDWTE